MAIFLVFLLFWLFTSEQVCAQHIDFGKVKLGTISDTGVHLKVPITTPFTCNVRIDSPGFYGDPTMSFSLGGGGNTTVNGLLRLTFTPRRPGKYYGYAHLEVPNSTPILIPLSGEADSVIPAGIFADYWWPRTDHLRNNFEDVDGRPAENAYRTSVVVHCLPFSDDTLRVLEIAGLKTIKLLEPISQYVIPPGASLTLNFELDTSSVGFGANYVSVKTNAQNRSDFDFTITTKVASQPELESDEFYDTVRTGSSDQIYVRNLNSPYAIDLTLTLPELRWPFSWRQDQSSYRIREAQEIDYECAASDSIHVHEYWLKTNAVNVDDSVKLTLVALPGNLAVTTTSFTGYRLRIDEERVSLSSTVPCVVRIHDAFGRLVSSGENVTSREWPLDRGLYLITVVSESLSAVRKIIVH